MCYEIFKIGFEDCLKNFISFNGIIEFFGFFEKYLYNLDCIFIILVKFKMEIVL